MSAVDPVRGSASERRAEELAGEIREELIERHRLAATEADDDLSLESRLRQLVGERAGILSEAAREELVGRVLRDTVGLGPLERLLADPEVDEVLVNGHEEVWVERRGRLERTPSGFESDTHLRDVIERILGPIGRRVDELEPMADGRLGDGSRVNVVIPPLAVDGPALSIRRFSGLRPGPEELERRGAIPAALMAILGEAVRNRRSLLISGGTGSGKTTVLNALSSFIASSERLITIEDAAELRLQQPHVVRLETRPASVEGSGGVGIRDLVRNALRMRPDRLIVGEVRGPEAMDLLVALNTGHSGALSTVHANSPAEALRRVEMLALMAGLEVPHDVVREQLANALDLVLHLERTPSGTRRALALAELKPRSGGIGLREVWSRAASQSVGEDAV